MTNVVCISVGHILLARVGPYIVRIDCQNKPQYPFKRILICAYLVKYNSLINCDRINGSKAILFFGVDLADIEAIPYETVNLCEPGSPVEDLHPNDQVIHFLRNLCLPQP